MGTSFGAVFLALMIGATAASSAVSAATMEAATGADGGSLILISGEIFRGDDERFATLAGATADDATVVLESIGGNLVAGLRIGSAIRMRAWRTAVADGATCASSCGLAWLGGVRRTVGQRARIGFHAAYIEGMDGIKREVGSGNALVGSYLGRLGLTDAAVIYLTSAPPEGAAWLTEATARDVGVRAEFAEFAVPGRTVTSVSPFPPEVLRSPLQTGPAPSYPAALLRSIYSGFPESVRTRDGEGCEKRACRIRTVGTEIWIGRDGSEHQLVVAVAEVKDDCHACAAILGLGLFRRSSPSDRWQTELVSPAAARVGGYGVFGGKVTFVDGGAFGRVIVLEDGGGGMGVSETSATVWLTIGGAFREVFSVPLSLGMSESCDNKDPGCREKIANGNYESRLTVTAAVDDTLHVEQTFTAAIAVPPASWVIDAAGRARQTAGGRTGPEATALERATLESPAFMQGRAERASLEAWFGGMQGDMRAGADFWAGRRSLRVPGTCETPSGKNPEWAAGCNDARRKFLALDLRRKADPEYRRGWNNP